MTTIDLWCPECRKVTRHNVSPDDLIQLPGRRAWVLYCGCGVNYKCTAPGMAFTDSVKEKLLDTREKCKMFWSPEELEACPDKPRTVMTLERVVRDAIVGYQEQYPEAPNDDVERELVKRAEWANGWLKDNGFEPEELVWSHEPAPSL